MSIIHPNDADSAVLADHLQRMGMKVRSVWPAPARPPEDAELIFLSWRAECVDPNEFRDWAIVVPIIAVISYESPTFLDHAINIGCTSMVTTPIRAAGLLSTIVMATHLHRHQRQQNDRIKRLEQKVTGMRQLAEAKAIIMRMKDVHEAQAYEILRSQAMAKRIPIEDVCSSVIQANDLFSEMASKKRNPV
ncbi:ANTAR domain-containing response regulator [Comamonas thiooxydans]|nr:ANTAR domain-containing protein [Comamonas thiooxydans]